MPQHVSSSTPLSEVSYFKRSDGLADVRVRHNIKTVNHPEHDGEGAWTEYTADEIYTVSTLTEQEAVEQADQLWRTTVAEETPVKERLDALESAILDNSDAIASLYVANLGGESK